VGGALSLAEFALFEGMIRTKRASQRPEIGVFYRFMDPDPVHKWIDQGCPH